MVKLADPAWGFPLVLRHVYPQAHPESPRHCSGQVRMGGVHRLPHRPDFRHEQAERILAATDRSRFRRFRRIGRNGLHADRSMTSRAEGLPHPALAPQRRG